MDPIISTYDRMVYFALSELFFDSGMFAYYRAGIFQMDINHERVMTHMHARTLTHTHTPTFLPVFVLIFIDV